MDALLHHHHRPGLEPMEPRGVVLQKGALGIETLRVFWHQVAFLDRWVFKFLASPLNQIAGERSFCLLKSLL